MNRTETFTLGMLTGAGLMYLLDPDRGRRRRALLRDQVVHAGHELEDTARAGGRQLRDRAVGLAHEARAELTEGPVEDRVLEERVRSAVGRAISNPGSLEVHAENGRVTLFGEVPSTEVQPLVRTARSVRGVRHVENRLFVTTNPDGRPGLQGARNS
jgi:osmotically-inducible protein OsmY